MSCEMSFDNVKGKQIVSTDYTSKLAIYLQFEACPSIFAEKAGCDGIPLSSQLLQET
jgi:hypothetical protein